MNGDLEVALPSQHKVVGRNIRREQQRAWAAAYEAKEKLAERSRSEIEESVVRRLKQELAASELLLVLFTAALASRRRNTLCEPFPAFLCDQNGPLFEETVRF